MKNHFEKFLLPVKFSIDDDALEQKYFSFQQLFHPDKAGIAEIENSMDINEAYAVLKNPLRRAAHILQLNGINVEEDGGAIRPDFATLEEVLEIQEKIPDLSAQEISDLKKSLGNQIKSLLENTAAKLDSEDFEGAAQFLIKAKYFDKVLSDLKKDLRKK